AARGIDWRAVSGEGVRPANGREPAPGRHGRPAAFASVRSLALTVAGVLLPATRRVAALVAWRSRRGRPRTPLSRGNGLAVPVPAPVSFPGSVPPIGAGPAGRGSPGPGSTLIPSPSLLFCWSTRSWRWMAARRLTPNPGGGGGPPSGSGGWPDPGASRLDPDPPERGSLGWATLGSPDLSAGAHVFWSFLAAPRPALTSGF